MSRNCTDKGICTIQGEAAVKAPLTIDGTEWLMTCVSMGNPHAITYGSSDGQPVKVSPLPALKVLCQSSCKSSLRNRFKELHSASLIQGLYRIAKILMGMA